MRKRTIAIMLAGSLLALAGCRTPGTPGGASFYECDRGTRLTVDYTGRGALVQVNGGRRFALRQTPSVGGSVYEGRTGERLQRNGASVTWNTAARTAPETCRTITVPR
jgi:hypothetical protein